MNAPMTKHIGPTLFLVDSDPVHKAATCNGCKFAFIHDFHYVFCDIQDRNGDVRLPPMVRSFDNRGKQVMQGRPNRFCPYIHRVETWQAGRRVPRTFEQMLRDMSYERGWVEECPGEHAWYFKKGKWLATANFNTKTISFTKLLPWKKTK